MVTVKITETYDMRTNTNKLGFIGVHTPSSNQIRRLYPGLCKNHKFIRVLSCDVVGVCASVLPADPLQIGTTGDLIAPEDMFNPILYKACTNESFDTLVSRIKNGTDVATLGSVCEGSLTTNPFETYYSLLADNHEFRKAMPQSGFSITNLVPIAHTVVSSYGNESVPGNNTVTVDDTTVNVPELASVNVSSNSTTGIAAQANAITYRGEPVRMPRLPLHYKPEAPDDSPQVFSIPKTFVLAMIVPPGKLHSFYYRVRVTWTVRFEELCSSISVMNTAGMVANASYYYGKNYTEPSAKLESETDSVDADDVVIEKIMES